MNENLSLALRSAYPEDMSQTAIETADGALLSYTWQDLDRGTAMIANLLGSLELPEGSRVLVQTEKSVEALMLYLAVLRAGLVWRPTEVPGTDVAEVAYQTSGWSQPRRGSIIWNLRKAYSSMMCLNCRQRLTTLLKGCDGQPVSLKKSIHPS